MAGVSSAGIFPAQQSNGLNGDNKIQVQVIICETRDL